MAKWFRVLSLVIAVSFALVMGLAGCGTSGTPASATSAAAGASTAGTAAAATPADNGGSAAQKVTLLSFPDLRTDVMKEELAAAKMQDQVEIQEVPQNQYENKVRISIAGGNITDLINMDAPNIANYAKMGALEPLDSYWDKTDFDDLVNSSKQAMTWNGKIWAAPLNESNVVLYYNKQMFADAGLTAPTKVEDAWTFDQLLDACKKLTRKDAGGNTTVYGILPEMFTINNRNEGMTYTEMLWIWWAGGDIVSPDGKTATGYFDSAATKKGLQFFADLYKNGYAPKQDIQGGFETGKIAMWIDGPWMVGQWQKDYPNFVDKWGAMPLPHDAAFASPSGSWNVSITAQSKNKALAWKAIQALAGKDGSTLYCTKTGNLPARKSVLDSPDWQKVASGQPYDIINQQLMSNSRARPVLPSYPQVSEAVMDAFSAVAFGTSVDSAVKDATAKIQKALDEGNQ